MNTWTPAELQSAIETQPIVFLKLWKNGCGACKLSIPALERIQAQDQHGCIFGQINTDEYPEMLEISDSEVLPVFFVFAGRTLKGKFLGFKGIEKLRAFIDHSLSEPAK